MARPTSRCTVQVTPLVSDNRNSVLWPDLRIDQDRDSCACRITAIPFYGPTTVACVASTVTRCQITAIPFCGPTGPFRSRRQVALCVSDNRNSVLWPDRRPRCWPPSPMRRCRITAIPFYGPTTVDFDPSVVYAECQITAIPFYGYDLSPVPPGPRAACRITAIPFYGPTHGLDLVSSLHPVNVSDNLIPFYGPTQIPRGEARQSRCRIAAIRFL